MSKRINIISKLLPNIKSILEVGVYKGDFSKILYDKFKPRRLVLIDPWKYEVSKTYSQSWYGGDQPYEIGQIQQDNYYNHLNEYFEKEIKNKRVQILRSTSDEAFKKINEKFDLIYIDGNHQYDFVLKDLINSIKCIKEEGFIMCDDYNSKGWWDNGVTKAVTNLILKGEIKIIDAYNSIRNHQCILKKI